MALPTKPSSANRAASSVFTSIAIIFNPNSTGNAQEEAKALYADLVQAFPDTTIKLLPTKRAGHAITLAYDFAKAHKKPLIISSSGDGGYNEVINGALRAQDEGATPVCAVLPAGNANDHARTMQDRPLTELIKARETTRLDILQLSTKSADGSSDSRYAHSYIGVGLTPTIAVELNKRNLNSLIEAWVVLKTFWNLRPVRIQVGDGKTVQKLDSLICSTIPEMAKVLTFGTESKPDDGLFELTSFKHNRKILLLLRLLKGAVAHLGSQRHLKTYSFTILSPSPIQLDGEVMKLKANTHVTVDICPRMLQTIALV